MANGYIGEKIMSPVPGISTIAHDVPLNIKDNLEGLLPDKQLPFRLQLFLSLVYISDKFAIILYPAPIGIGRGLTVIRLLLDFHRMHLQLLVVFSVGLLVLEAARANHCDSIEQCLLCISLVLASFCSELIREGGEVDLGFICYLVNLIGFIDKHLI